MDSPRLGTVRVTEPSNQGRFAGHCSPMCAIVIEREIGAVRDFGNSASAEVGLGEGPGDGNPTSESVADLDRMISPFWGSFSRR